MRNFTATLYWNSNSNGLDISGHGTHTIDFTINDDGTLQGPGVNNSGVTFTIGGTLIGDSIRFIQRYDSNGKTWTYLGSRVAPNLGNTFQFAGSWSTAASAHGVDRPRAGLFVLTGVDTGATVQHADTKQPDSAGVPKLPYNLVEGFWTGTRREVSATTQINFVWSLGLDSSAPYSDAGPYSLTGIGCDSVKGIFTLTGTVTKAAPNVTISLEVAYSDGPWSWEVGVEPTTGSGDGIYGDAASKVLGILHAQRVPQSTTDMANVISPLSNVNLGAPSASLEEFQAIHRVIIANPSIPIQDLYQLVWNFTS